MFIHVCVHACEWVCPWVCTIYVLSCQTRILWKVSTFYINIRQWAREQDEQDNGQGDRWKLKSFGLIWVVTTIHRYLFWSTAQLFLIAGFKSLCMCASVYACLCACMSVVWACGWVWVCMRVFLVFPRNMWTWMHWFARAIITKPQTKWIILRNLLSFDSRV